MRSRPVSALRTLRGSGTGPAVWLAGAMIVNNLIALLASVVFARLLNDYGGLAALISYLIILTVAGQALQVATAREGVLGHLGRGPDLLITLRAWSRGLAWFTAAASLASVLARGPIAALVGVGHDPGGQWAAAAGIPAGCAFLALCILRGALQSVGELRSVGVSLIGEQAVRLAVGGMLAAAGLGIAGAYLGSLAAYIAMMGFCARSLVSACGGPGARVPTPAAGAGPLSRPGMGRHVRHAAVPILALGIVQLLQNVDLILAKHRMSGRLDSSYAVAAVAAKVLIWVAMGASFSLVPETSRRAAAGEDTRTVLVRTLAVVAVCAVPCLAIFALGAHPLLSAVFGSRRAVASGSLLPLGAAFTLLAATYLAVQYLLALKRVGFLLAIGAVAVAEPLLLLGASTRPSGFAVIVLAVQAVGAVLAYAAALSIRPAAVATVSAAGGGSEEPQLLSVGPRRLGPVRRGRARRR